MSTYWDAVARTALGLAGTAEPRPRSIFESDNRRLASDDGDRLEDAAVTPDGPADVSGAPARAATPAIEAPPNFDGVTAPVAPEIQQTDRLEARAVSASDRSAFDATPADASPPTQDAAAREVRTERIVERVEVQRFETIHTIVEAAPRASQREAPATRPVPVVAVPANVVVGDRRDEAAARRHEDTASLAPTVVAAEPSRAIAEPPPLGAVAREVAPLVIEIDHIDIRIESATPVASVLPRRREREAVPSLDDYLQRRSEGRR